MPQKRFAQLHRQLLFHWTMPDTETPKKIVPLPKTRAERSAYVEHLGEILKNGLEFNTPEKRHAEHIVKGSIEATLPMLCFSEWSVSGGLAQAGRYGHMGLGFTRKFIMEKGGRQVIYLPNKANDPFRMAMVKLLENAKKSNFPPVHLDLITSLLKTYSPSTEKPSSNTLRKPGNAGKVSLPKADDLHLDIDFGGLYKNLEDKEWRVIQPKDSRRKIDTTKITCEPGSLAMIVLPDHKTLAHVMQHEGIRARIFMEDKPAVCLLTREMLYSI